MSMDQEPTIPFASTPEALFGAPATDRPVVAAALKLPGIQEHPKEIRPRRMTLGERLYLPLLSGMMVTIRHMFANLFGLRKRVTIQYPEERRQYSHRYRGHHILTTRPDGSVRCVACFLCATNCPAECIHIEAADQPDVNVEKYPLVYEIDMLRCVFCGYCVDACPEEAIIMSNNYDMAYYTRDQSIVGKADLMKPYTFDPARLGYRPYYPEEDVKHSSMRTDAKAAFDLVAAAKSKSAPAA